MAETNQDVREHRNPDLLLNSYNRQCRYCRKAVSEISEKGALRMLADEAVRGASGRLSRIRLNNAITIWQSAAKRAMKAGG
jgi:hypothetical protein